jgi:cytochrome c
MDELAFNKVAAAVLTAGIIAMVCGIIANIAVRPQLLEKPAYAIAGVEASKSAAAAGGEAAKGPEPIQPLMASADAKAGEQVAKKCAVCHTFDKGGKNLIGPNLWGVVGRARASEPGFTYSDAMKAKGGTWTVPDLVQFIANPKAFVPGTAMTFTGIPRAGERADVAAYLNSLADNPAPLTKAAEAPAAASSTQQASTSGR